MDIHAEQLGLVAGLMCQSKKYRTYPVACIQLWIEPAINHRQIWFAFDNLGRAVGYFTWAFLAPDVEARMATDPNVLFHYSEWNEGENLWIMDLVAPFGHANDIVRFIRDVKFVTHKRIHWARRNTNGTVRKMMTFNRRCLTARQGSNAKDLYFHLPPEAFAESKRHWSGLE